MRLKDNTVKIQGIRPELLFALNVADIVWMERGQELVLTSLGDGKHSKASLHYSGNAADLRTNYFDSDEKKSAASSLKSKLNIDYDVVVEKTHIHLEYQPKLRG